MDKKYREYLISKKWSAIKMAVRYFYEDECYICQNRNNLHVHHKTYDRLYHEDLDDLVLVCHTCHNCIHDKRYTKEDAYKMLLDGTYKDELTEVFGGIFTN